MGREFKNLPSRSRCGIVLAAGAGAGSTHFEQVMREAAREMRQALPQADIVAMLTEPDQEELRTIIANNRAMGARFDGCLNIQLPGPGRLEEFRGIVPVLHRVMGGELDNGRCCVLIGDAAVARPGYGNYSFTQLMWIDRTTDWAQFSDWWAGHHSEHNIQGPSGGVMQGYALHHRADPITTEINAEFGFSNDPELYEPCFLRDLKSIRELITPEVAEAAFEDEKGFLSHHEMRAEMQRVILEDIAR